MRKNMADKKNTGGIDWSITVFPLAIIACISFLLLIVPEAAGNALAFMKNFFVNKIGFFYTLLGLGVLLTAIGLGISSKGKIKCGSIEKPKYSNFSWGAMIFTSTMAADIVYWSLIEWCYYYSEKPFAKEALTLAERQDYASTYPLFHWGPIPWAIYLLPACAYAYMMFVKKRKRQTLSEACRPLLGDRADKKPGRIIDIFSIVGLLAGTSTTFSLATPLLSEAVGRILGIETSPVLSIIILLIIGLVFIIAVLKGMKAVSHLATICVVLFGMLLAAFLIFGPKVYIIETGITAIGNMVNEFFHMATWMDPLRLSGTGGMGFPQNWTIFYWSYWISWFVATPFFIAKISEGRTIRQIIFGGMLCGLLGTYTSFIVFGGFGLHLQTAGSLDLAGALSSGMEPSAVIMMIFEQFPVTEVVLAILALAMIAFYASTFDAITLVVAGYSEKDMRQKEEPRKRLRAFWAFVFLLLPIALMFSESTLSSLQTISIIAAFPLGIILILIVISFFRELKKDTAPGLLQKPCGNISRAAEHEEEPDART